MSTTYKIDTILNYGERIKVGTAESRLATSTLSSVDGVFVQQFGTGARRISIDGFFQSIDAPGGESSASQDIEPTTETKRVNNVNKAPGRLTFNGVDYDNCIMVRYEKASPIQFERVSGATFRAYCRMVAEFIQLYQ